MRRPENLELIFPTANQVQFKTACGAAEGVAIWRDWGYHETSYDTVALTLLDQADSSNLIPSLKMASDSPGHFYVTSPISENLGWCFHVELLGFRFEIDTSELEDLGLGNLIVQPDNEDEPLNIQDDALAVGDWIKLEIKELTF